MCERSRGTKIGGSKLVCCDEEMICVTKDLTALNFIKAFSGKSQARNKYELYGDIVLESGYHATAKHFYEAAENEKWHARAEFKAYHELIDDPIEIYLTLCLEKTTNIQQCIQTLQR